MSACVRVLLWCEYVLFYLGGFFSFVLVFRIMYITMQLLDLEFEFKLHINSGKVGCEYKLTRAYNRTTQSKTNTITVAML